MSDPTQNQDNQNTSTIASAPNDQTATGPAIPVTDFPTPGTPLVSIPVQTDLPPAPDFMSVNNGGTSPSDTGPTVQPSDNPSTPPSDFFPPATSSSPPKKKFGGGRLIATTLGIFLLVGGLGAGMLLISQPQIFQPKATSYNTCVQNCGLNTGVTNPGSFGYVYPDSSDNGQPYVAGTYIAPNGQRYTVNSPGTFAAAVNFYMTSSPSVISQLNFSPSVTTNIQAAIGPTCGAGGTCASGSTCNAGTNTCILDTAGTGNCSTYHGGNCFVTTAIGVGSNGQACSAGGHWTTCSSGYSCDNDDCVPPGGSGTSPPNTTPTTPPVVTPNPTPVVTPTPTPSSASCSEVKAYDSGWNLLSASELSSLKAGNNIELCVSGIASAGTFDMGKFTINGVVQTTTTTQRPGSSDFCQAYVIPTGVYTFNTTAQIHNTIVGWVGP